VSEPIPPTASANPRAFSKSGIDNDLSCSLLQTHYLPPDLFPPRTPRTRGLSKMKFNGELLEQAVRPGRKQVRLRFAKGYFQVVQS
jgi:hypothetical protein